jgi:hypothetical protein
MVERVIGARDINNDVDLAPGVRRMPELSRFFGIIIRMYMEAGAPHNAPHFHAYYQEHQADFSVEPIDLLAGDSSATATACRGLGGVASTGIARRLGPVAGRSASQTDRSTGLNHEGASDRPSHGLPSHGTASIARRV